MVIEDDPGQRKGRLYMCVCDQRCEMEKENLGGEGLVCCWSLVLIDEMGPSEAFKDRLVTI